MALNLDVLDEVIDKTAPAGAALFVAANLLIEDPDNPRTEFGNLEELAADIRRRGILQPIVVRPRTNGRYMIRFGARRYRAGLMAGLTEFPVLIASDARHFDTYSQVAENRQRDALTPLEEALFIQARLREGHKKKDIAARMGISPSTLTYLCALLDPPDFVMELYHKGACRTPDHLYRLRKLYEASPEVVRERALAVPEITRAFLDDLSAVLNPNAGARTVTPANQSGASDMPTIPRTDAGPAAAAGEGVEISPAEPISVARTDMYGAGGHSERARYTVVMVKHAGRLGQLLLNKRASTQALGWVRYPDNQEEREVLLSECTLDALMER